MKFFLWMKAEHAVLLQKLHGITATIKSIRYTHDQFVSIVSRLFVLEAHDVSKSKQLGLQMTILKYWSLPTFVHCHLGKKQLPKLGL